VNLLEVDRHAFQMLASIEGSGYHKADFTAHDAQGLVPTFVYVDSIHPDRGFTNGGKYNAKGVVILVPTVDVGTSPERKGIFELDDGRRFQIDNVPQKNDDAALVRCVCIPLD
jgi:hypothetical protein